MSAIAVVGGRTQSVGRGRSRVRRWWAGAILAAVALLFVLPFFWVLAHSLETSAEWHTGAVTFWPSHMTFGNYFQIIVQDDFLENLLASIVVSSITTAITLVLSSLAGYALARLPVRPRSHPRVRHTGRLLPDHGHDGTAFSHVPQLAPAQQLVGSQHR